MPSKLGDRFAACLIALGILFFMERLQGSVFGQSADADAILLSSANYSMPASAVDAEIGGTVVVAVRIDETGKPVKAVLSTGPMWPCGDRPVKALEVLASSLAESMMALSFSPAMRGGKPVEENVALTIQLKNPKIHTGPAPIDPATGKPKVTRINGGLLSGKATHPPKPVYPAEARANRDSGTVTIEVLVDEVGKVARAGAVSGAPTLQFAAREAACGAKFSPTRLMGNPVTVSGVLVYNFVP